MKNQQQKAEAEFDRIFIKKEAPDDIAEFKFERNKRN